MVFFDLCIQQLVADSFDSGCQGVIKMTKGTICVSSHWGQKGNKPSKRVNALLLVSALSGTFSSPSYICRTSFFHANAKP